ncbi:alpha/beta hydrolase [Streptomyces albiaxialis]|uniref:Alpha/beta hydrolase n=1 Tax=Streptomyces albiaxialis TaxID=329523 RepID=A0ABP5HHD8_9ACTN
MGKRLGGVVVSAALAAGSIVGTGGASVAAGAAGDGAGERRSYTGEIDGAKYRVEVPEDWNGTLLQFSHGYYPAGWSPEKIALTNSEEAEKALLDKGFALAASGYKGTYGYAVEDALTDQLALRDWFAEHVGRPGRTISTGQSMGGTVATLLGERYPERFDGVLAMCAEYDGNGTWNTTLDMTYALRTLLVPEADQDIDLVRPRDAERSVKVLETAVDKALKSKRGRARLALAGSLGNVPGWYSAHEARPEKTADRVRAQAKWLRNAYIAGTGPLARLDLERRAGGNPSTNAGVDYRRQVAGSAQKDLVRKAYAEAGAAGAGLSADLAKLNAGERIAPDAKAVDYMNRYTIACGTAPGPVVTLHNAQDGGAVSDQAGWYAGQVRRHGDPDNLRQMYVDRGSHCAFSAADEITALKTLLAKGDTGRWPSTDPRTLNRSVSRYEPRLQQVLDLGTFEKKAVPPAFTHFTPARFPRPSR